MSRKAVSKSSPKVLTQERRLKALVAQAKRGKPWSDQQIAAIDYSDAWEIVESGLYPSLPEWARAVTEAILFEFYLDLDKTPEPSALAFQRFPRSVAKLVTILGGKPPAS